MKLPGIATLCLGLCLGLCLTALLLAEDPPTEEARGTDTPTTQPVDVSKLPEGVQRDLESYREQAAKAQAEYEEAIAKAREAREKDLARAKDILEHRLKYDIARAERNDPDLAARIKTAMAQALAGIEQPGNHRGGLYAIASHSNLGKLYKVDPTDGSWTLLGNTGLRLESLAYVPELKTLVSVDCETGALVTIHPANAKASARLGPGRRQLTFPSRKITGLAYDAGAGVLYAVDSDSKAFAADLRSGQIRTLGPVGYSPIRGLAFDPHTSTLYGYYEPKDEDSLITISTTTGKGTLVGSCGVHDGDGFAFDPVRRVLYTRCRHRDRLYSIDPGTRRSGPNVPLREFGVFGFAVIPKGRPIARQPLP